MDRCGYKPDLRTPGLRRSASQLCFEKDRQRHQKMQEDVLPTENHHGLRYDGNQEVQSKLLSH